MKNCCKKIPHLPRGRDARGDTPLHREILEIPLEPLCPTKYSRGQVNECNFCLQTPVHYAAMAGCLHLLPHIESACYHQPDLWGNTPIHLAAQHGHLNQIPPEILNKKSLLRRNKRGLSALHLAAGNKHLRQVPPSLRGIPTLLSPNRADLTALHEAFYAGDFGLLPDPLLEAPFRHLPDHNKTTPLHRAAEGGHLSALHSLKPLRLEELLLPNHQGETPLHLAPFPTIPDEFLTRQTLTLKTDRGDTPLHKAAEEGTLLIKLPNPDTHLLELVGEGQVTLLKLLTIFHPPTKDPASNCPQAL